LDTTFYTLSLSLFDSLSTTLQIIIFVLLLTTVNPLRNALSYLAGLSGSYFLCGFAGYFVVDDLRNLVNKLLPTQTMANPPYYLSEFLTGVVMVVIGVWYFYRKRGKPHGRMMTWVISKLLNMNVWFALAIGVFISVSSFPASLPYIIALGKYASLQLGIPAVIGWILFYNLGYALPMLLILGIYLIARRNIDFDHDTLHEHARKLNLHLTTWTMVVFGVFFMIDAACFFTIGHALIKGRYF